MLCKDVKVAEETAASIFTQKNICTRLPD